MVAVEGRCGDTSSSSSSRGNKCFVCFDSYVVLLNIDNLQGWFFDVDDPSQVTMSGRGHKATV
jgi:hypothetical protein